MTTDDQHPPESDQPTGDRTSISGGVSVDAQRDIAIGGDVVGRDKIEQISGDKVEGDKIVASGDVVIRRQITRTTIHIGQLNVPLIPMLAGVGIALAILIFISLNVARLNQSIAPTPTPGRMSSTTFNVVVAEFGEVDASGQVRVTDQSRALSQSVYDTLQAQREAFPDPIIKSSIAIRYGGLPVANGLVADEATASNVVDLLGADMLIYGNLAADGSFSPQFYVSPSVRAEVDALLTGNQTVGTLRFTSGAAFGASTDLRTRASALFFIATGLAYDVFGRAARSLEVYRQAEQQLIDWPEQGAGKEILYFFKGQAALFQAQQTTGRVSTDLLTEAAADFQHAIDSNPAYARARIGLGSALYVRLQRVPVISDTLGSPDLQRMLDEYNAAPELARQAGDRLAELVGGLSQGIGEYHVGRATRPTDRAAARAAFAGAIERITSIIPALTDLRQPRVLAQAQLALGAIYIQQAEIDLESNAQAESKLNYQHAQQAFEACVAQAANSTDRILIDLIVRDRCQPQLERVNQILSGP
ncbi:MAG: hypothetical protein HY870_15995 [Chloroflexi bacterium]|nr:hypothetical protein [Chloroflexota bacterium]